MNAAGIKVVALTVFDSRQWLLRNFLDAPFSSSQQISWIAPSGQVTMMSWA
jgi:hypothetical protein